MQLDMKELEAIDTLEFVVSTEYDFAYREFCDNKDNRYFIVEYKNKNSRLIAIRSNRPFIDIHFENIASKDSYNRICVINDIKNQCDMFFQNDGEDARKEDTYGNAFFDTVITSWFEQGKIKVHNKGD